MAKKHNEPIKIYYKFYKNKKLLKSFSIFVCTNFSMDKEKTQIKKYVSKNEFDLLVMNSMLNIKKTDNFNIENYLPIITKTKRRKKKKGNLL